MKTQKIKATLFALIFCAATGVGLSSCGTGNDAGDTNREDSAIRETDQDLKQSNRDTTDYDHRYDHAKHPDSTAIGDGAYNQDGKRDKRP